MNQAKRTAASSERRARDARIADAIEDLRYRDPVAYQEAIFLLGFPRVYKNK